MGVRGWVEARCLGLCGHAWMLGFHSEETGGDGVRGAWQCGTALEHDSGDGGGEGR